jgi:hypothetical protein
MLRVWFYDPGKDTDGILNKMVAYLDAPFCHCELQFRSGVACSIYLGTTMTMKKRDFDPFFYTRVDIPCSSEQERLAKERAQELHLKGELCTILAMSSCVHKLNLGRNTTFCSKVVGDILQYAGLLENVCIDTLSPSALYRQLNNKQASRLNHIIPTAHKSMALEFKCEMKEVESLLKFRV